MSFPFEFIDVEPEVANEVSSVFHKRKDGFLQVGPKKYFMYPKYREQAAGYYNMELRPDDVWVVTFPRSGTTWCQELVWLINNDLDYDRALKEKLWDRFPFLEYSILFREDTKKEMMEKSKGDPKAIKAVEKMSQPGYDIVAEMESPRHIKTHFPLSLVPPSLLDTCKVVYVARNPKDVAVSCYYLNTLLEDLEKGVDFSKYWDLFQRDLLIWSPFWSHVDEAWKLRNHPNMLFLFYEDMKKDLPAVIHKVADFLNKTLTDEQVDNLVDHLNISKFRDNPALQPNISQEKLTKEGAPGFYRKGESGSWKNDFTPELNAMAAKWIKENERHTDLRFQL